MSAFPDEDEDAEDEAPMLVEVPGQENGGDSGVKAALPDLTRIIPVTIITGYLGSGKSTLLNYLLKADHGKRLAIIENEFSAGLGIEGMIAKSGIDDSNLGAFFELNNGCLCCTVKGDLLVTLEQLVLHKDRFDCIVIETTGVANPGPVISTFWTDESLGSCLKLDGVVCVVDSSNLDFYLQSSDTSSDVRMQISYADRILLNKSDLVSSKQELERMQQDVRAMNSMAELRVTSFASIDCDWILGIDCYSVKSPDVVVDMFCAPCGSSPADTLPTHSARTLASCNLSFPGLIDLSKLNKFLDSLLYDNGRFLLSDTASANTHHLKEKGSADMRIFRMKGILHVQGNPVIHILQAVHDIFDIQPSLVERETERDVSSGLNHVIVIGRNVDEGSVFAGLRACVC